MKVKKTIITETIQTTTETTSEIIQTATETTSETIQTTKERELKIETYIISWKNVLSN